MKKVLMSVMVLWFGLAGAVFAADGQILYEKWIGLEGIDGNLDSLINHPEYPDNPTDSVFLSEVDGWEEDDLNNWGGRMTGYLIVPESGYYEFWIASDDDGECWLSPTDDFADGVKIAEVAGWCPRYDWDNTQGGSPGENQKSAAIPLAKGQRYPLVVRWADGTGGGFAAVAWQGQGIADRAVIGSDYLTTTPPNADYYAAKTAPVQGAKDVPIAGTTLAWNAPTALDGVTGYNVYLSADELLAIDPNSGTASPAYLGTVGAAGPLQIATGALDNDSTYYWRVDVVIDDPNIIVGYASHFDTVKLNPIITTQPEDVKVGIDCSVLVTLSAISGEYDDAGTLSYQWFDAATDAAVTGALTSADIVATVGEYYCTVSNGYGEAVSRTVKVIEPGHMAVGSLEQGMIGYWSFDVDGGDDSGNGINTSLTNEAKITEGLFGNALECDGTDDSARSGKQPSELGIDGNKPRSVSCWAKTRSWGSRGLYDMGNRADGQDFSLRLANDTPNENHWRVQYWGGPDWDFNTMDPTAHDGMNMGGNYTFDCLNNWVHWVHTYDASGTKIYANGRLIVSFGDAINTADSYDWRIGVYGDAEAWDGWIDDVGLWNRAITAEEVAALYDAGQTGKTLAGTSWAPSNITPDGSAWVDPEADVQVTWDKHPLAPCSGAVYSVYIVPDNDGNADFTTAVPLATASASPAVVPVSAHGLEFEGKYWLRVDVGLGAESEAGMPVYFETIHRVPVIAKQPVATLVYPGEAAEFSVEATSIMGEMSYTWFKEVAEGDDVEVATGNPGVIADTDIDDIGMYYCVIENSAGQMKSASAYLELKELIGHWTLDAIEGADTVADSSRFERHGVALSDPNMPLPEVVPGKVGSGLSFDGISQWVDTGLLASELGIGGSHAKSVSVWVYARAFNDGGIWDLGNRASGQNWGLRTENEAQGDHGWRVQYWGGDYDFNTDTGYRLYDAPERWNVNRPAPVTFASMNEWVHFVLSYDGQTTRVYANGRLIVVFPRVLNTGEAFTFRIAHYGPANEKFDGVIDDLRLYNYGLTGEEAARLYMDVVPGSMCPEDPMYDFNGDCDTDLSDFAMFMAAWMECNLEPCDRW